MLGRIGEWARRFWMLGPELATHELRHYDWLRPLDANGHRIHVGGWVLLEPRPWRWKPGDFVIVHVHDQHRTTRYRVVWRKCYTDPDDMWSAELEFAPRLTQQEEHP